MTNHDNYRAKLQYNATRNNPASYAWRLRQALGSHRMSPRQLGNRLGAQEDVVNAWADGHRDPERDERHKIAAVLDMNVDLTAPLDVSDTFDGRAVLGPDGVPLHPNHPLYQQLSATVRDVSEEVITRLANEPHLLRDLHWRDFEQLIADLFARDGFDVHLTSRSGDRGVDLYAARHTGLGSLLYVVQAKQWAEHRPVGPDVVLALRGAMDRDRATAGVIATTSRFTVGAMKEQSELRWRISLHDFQGIRRWLSGDPIFHSAAHPDYARKSIDPARYRLRPDMT